MTRDNNSKGIFLIIIAMTLFAMQDSLIKYIFEKSSLYEIFFGRYFLASTTQSYTDMLPRSYLTATNSDDEDDDDDT